MSAASWSPRAAAVLCLALAACGPQMAWRKPGATTAEFNRTNYACVQDSNAQAPVAQRVTSVTTERSTSTNRSSRDQRRAAQQESVTYTDINRDARTRIYGACMRAAGWNLEPVQMATGGATTPVAARPALAPAAAESGDLCRAGTRVFAYSDDAWYAATARAAQAGGCLVRFDGGDASDDEVIPPGSLARWANAGPGVAVTACRRGEQVLAFSEDGWYPATIKADGSAQRCPVTFTGYGADEDETLPLSQIRRF